MPNGHHHGPPVRAPSPVARRQPSGHHLATTALPKGEAAVLSAIAQHGDDGVTREQLTVLTGYKRSTRDAYVQRLGEREAIAFEGDRIIATLAGVDLLGSSFRPLPIGDALREYWLERLPGGERRVLEAVVAAYPASVAADSISAETEFKRSTRDAYLQRLNARKLVTRVGRGEVRASDMLFGGGPL